MTLIEHNPVCHLLDGLVKCRHCATSMATAGESFAEAPRYVCVTRHEGCTTPDIEAEPFTRLVVRRAIHAFLDPQNTARVRRIIVDEAMKEGNAELRTMLDLTPVRPTPPEEAPPNQEGQLTMISLRYVSEDAPLPGRGFPPVPESGTSRKLEEYALNPDTYLRPSNLRVTKSIMEVLIREILVGPHSATIHYSLPVHPGGWPEPGNSEEVPIR